MFYLMSVCLARGRQEVSPDWLQYKSGKGAGFLRQNSLKSLASLLGRMTTLHCWYPVTHTHNMFEKQQTEKTLQVGDDILLEVLM